jgi:hypothetical protein
MENIIEVSKNDKSFYNFLNLTIYFDKSDLIIGNGKKTIRLLNAIDNNETIDNSRVYLILNKGQTNFRTIGGEITYLIDISEIDIISFNKLYRDEKFSEYWYTNIESKWEKTIFELENEIIIIDDKLQIINHYQKYFDERIINFDNQTIIIQSDNDRRIIVL